MSNQCPVRDSNYITYDAERGLGVAWSDHSVLWRQNKNESRFQRDGFAVGIELNERPRTYKKLNDVIEKFFFEAFSSYVTCIFLNDRTLSLRRLLLAQDSCTNTALGLERF